jgi:6-pyruvoyl-tetrahydropterin synthase
MFRATKGIHIHFAHVVYGHSGLCLGPHGHTWYFELTLQADTLDAEGFVCDFSTLKRKVLTPIEIALDHAFAIGSEVYPKIAADLQHMGDQLLGTRVKVHGLQEACVMQDHNMQKALHLDLPELEVQALGSCKVAVFQFNPTSERLSKWLYDVAVTRMEDVEISVSRARVYETLHPVQSYAEYSKT